MFPRKRISFGSLVNIELKKYKLAIAANVKMMISIDVAPLSINLTEYEQLFDLKNDPGELEDLFNSTNPVHQQKLVDMRKRFVELKMMAHSDLSIIL